MQHDILLYLLRKEEAVQTGGDLGAKGEFYDKGVPWGSKPFMKMYPRWENRSSISTSIGKLRSRGLVALFDSARGLGQKPNTTHAKLTGAGREAARAYRDDPRSEVEKRLEVRRRRHLEAIQSINIGRWLSQKPDERQDANRAFEAAVDDYHARYPQTKRTRHDLLQAISDSSEENMPF